MNSQVIREIVNAFKIDLLAEKIPQPIPVVEVGVKSSKTIDVVRSAAVTNAASTTLYTTPTDQDFYLTFASLNTKNASAAGSATIIAVNVTIDGQVRMLLGHVNFVSTNTTGPTSPFICGNHPIKVDRNTAITLTMDSPTTSDRAFASIAGYLDVVQ
jgi:hypothetical protein